MTPVCKQVGLAAITWQRLPECPNIEVARSLWMALV